VDRIEAAFAAVPREGFLREAERGDAAVDGPLPIGHRQTSSQPRTVAAMLRLLAVRSGQRVLDVGSGSGWTTALLAHLTGPDGEVVGVELVPELARWGAANLAANLAASRAATGTSWARIQQAVPGELGVPAGAPYDRILVSAVARELPQALLDQLGDPGRMVIPVDGTMTLVVREHGYDDISSHGSYRFVPLR
jgi:protein-L-isoaspartate(D-aspartate) O-methyltransferase